MFNSAVFLRALCLVYFAKRPFTNLVDIVEVRQTKVEWGWIRWSADSLANLLRRWSDDVG